MEDLGYILKGLSMRVWERRIMMEEQAGNRG